MAFDPEILDENSRSVYDGRRLIGLKACDLADDNDPETNAMDVISDILTYVVGPSGTFSFTEGDTRYERREQWTARDDARALLDRALRSWLHDDEDYIERDASL